MTRKKTEDKKYGNTGFSYPPELKELVEDLREKRELSGIISGLLAEKYKIKIEAT